MILNKLIGFISAFMRVIIGIVFTVVLLCLLPIGMFLMYAITNIFLLVGYILVSFTGGKK